MGAFGHAAAWQRDSFASSANYSVELTSGDRAEIVAALRRNARARFAEYEDPQRRRHLIRLWLDAEGFRDVPREVHLFGVNGVPPQQGRACTFDFKQLYRDDPRATGRMPDARIGDSELKQ